MWYNNILETVGNTPIVKLNRVTRDIKATVLAKLEFFNPGGSVKDRMAIYMIEDAEKRGLLNPGGTIVENTSGNTGIGLAMYGAAKGYKVILTAFDKISKEKLALLKALGAEVIICPTEVPPDSPESYYEVAKRIAKETPNSFLVNQYHNKKNIESHYMTTGLEIWEQTKGKFDYIVIGAGTGGTISGVGKFLKEKNPKIKVIGVDPIGSIYYDYFKHKKFIEPKTYLVEGIGEDMLCGAIDFDVIDDMIQVSDKDSFLTARQLLKEEGIFAGGSSGSAVWASLKVAKDLPEDKIVLTILPDGGYNYLSKIYNDEWMKEKGFI
ncbi:cysteine synthase family protein [candidate division WOR-3 bacterium]|nr:cysteine synthase family protein [candidate division WOR-3 bacterium]